MADVMPKGRLQSFSDGVFAIIITIMVLELRPPRGADPQSLIGLWPVFVSYLLSFLMIAIYWVNHHHLFHKARNAHTGVLWSNAGLLFFLSLLPFSTAYMGENDFAPFPTAVYAASLVLCGLAFIPVRAAVMAQLPKTARSAYIARHAVWKNYIALGCYLAAIPLAYVHSGLALGLCFAVAALYILPNAFLEN